MAMELVSNIEFTEALKDSPRFRHCIWQNEQYLTMLESKLKDLLRLCQTMIEFGKSYVASFYNLMMGVEDMSNTCFKGDPVTQNAFSIISQAYGDIMKFQKVLVEQAHWSIIKNLSDFIRREMGKIQEMKSHFQRVSQSLDDALLRNSSVTKQKEQDKHEARNELTAVGTCFAHTALDYVFQMNLIQARRGHEILDAGHDMFGEGWEENKLRTSETLASLKQKSRQVERKMQDRHMLVPKEIFQHPPGMSPEPDVVMEGYLFKRATNAFKTWHRRWFLIRENRLLYCRRDSELSSTEKAYSAHHSVTDDGFTVMEPDLRVCLVRPAANTFERSCCFELVTPTKNHMLQADSESLCAAWVKALQRSIESAINDPSPQPDNLSSNGSVGGDSGSVGEPSSIFNPPDRSPVNKPRKKRALDELKDIPGNDRCADCGSPNPKWASINLGITLCIECCGIHRQPLEIRAGT